jgi:hypothetical protein
MRTVRGLLSAALCLIILVMVVFALPISRHETVAYSHALGAFHDAPSDATRRALEGITAEENRTFFKTELLLCIPLLAAGVTIGLITRRLRTRNPGHKRA